VKIDLKGVKPVRRRLASGEVRVYYYHRPTGIRLNGDPSSHEFLTKLAELNETPSAPLIDPRSIEALIITYKESPEFKDLAASTRRSYIAYLDQIRALWGKLAAKGIERRHVFALRDKFADKPAAANYLVRVLRLLLSFAVDRGWRRDNPAQRPKRLKTGDGHRPWEEYEIERFRSYWPIGTEERLAFELLLNTGQRGGDVNAMVRTHYRQGFISVVQEKTGVRVDIPVSADLRAALDPWTDACPQGLLLLPGARGKGRGIDAFRHWMSGSARSAGLSGVTIHGLRYTAATRLAEIGLPWRDIADITGHQTAEMARKYSEKRRRVTLSIASLDKATGHKPRGARTRVPTDRS
jgi:integrase